MPSLCSEQQTRSRKWFSNGGYFVWLAPITTNYQLVWALSARIVVAHLWSNVRRSATPPAQLPLFALMSEDGG